MRVLTVLVAVVIGVGCSTAEKDAEIARLKAEIAAGKQQAAPPPVQAPPPSAVPAAAGGKPYIEAEWCSFACYQNAVAEEISNPTFSDETMRLAAMDEKGGSCARACPELHDAIGCRDVEEHRDVCITKLNAIQAIGGKAAGLCELIENGVLGHCCATKRLRREACRVIGKDMTAFLGLPREQRVAILRGPIK